MTTDKDCLCGCEYRDHNAAEGACLNCTCMGWTPAPDMPNTTCPMCGYQHIAPVSECEQCGETTHSHAIALRDLEFDRRGELR